MVNFLGPTEMFTGKANSIIYEYCIAMGLMLASSSFLCDRGMFKNDKMDGKGTLSLQDGSVIAGEFRNGVMHGRSIFRRADGKELECEFRNGERVHVPWYKTLLPVIVATIIGVAAVAFAVLSMRP